jgi:hypothetical protein
MEQETTFRWDEAERVLWAGTTAPRVAARWRRDGHPVVVIGQEHDGTPCSWEVKVPWTGQRRPWLRLIGQAISQWKPLADAAATERAQDDPRVVDAV